MKTLLRDRKPAHFKMDFSVDGGFSADNQDVENDFEIAADLQKKVVFKSKNKTI